jgi:2-C-methyl-D-erythritol 4-phosphate cytidylyltransferase
MVFGIILAGGSGERMGGGELPKQFALLGGKPLIIYSVEEFLASDKIDATVVVCPGEWEEYLREMLYAKYYCGSESELHIVTGGATRNDSLQNACTYIRKNLSTDPADIVVTHDAARPFVTQKMIEDNLDAIESCDAVCTAIPATDTILYVQDDENVSGIPKRSEYYQAQTPQTFRLDSFCELYAQLSEEERADATDACKIFALTGRKVKLAPGDASNIKITVPQDIIIAEAILSVTTQK